MLSMILSLDAPLPGFHLRKRIRDNTIDKGKPNRPLFLCCVIYFINPLGFGRCRTLLSTALLFPCRDHRQLPRKVLRSALHPVLHLSPDADPLWTRMAMLNSPSEQNSLPVDQWRNESSLFVEGRGRGGTLLSHQC